MSKSTKELDRRLPVGRKRAERKSAPVEPTLKKAIAAQPAVGGLRTRLICAAVLLATGIYAYLPTLRSIVQAWEQEPDYSHGFLVVPAALFFLWTRRQRCPGVTSPGWLVGLSLVAASLAIRVFAAAYYFESIDGWSILLWLAGTIALLFGNAVLLWSLPCVGFLVFMIPLPFRVEGMLSLPLQRIATILSCWTLQLLGQASISEGNTILLGSHRLEVEQACSGLRLFVSVLALASAYTILVKRTWWEKALLMASAVPIAIIANAARIVVTGLLYQYASGEAAKRFSHDFAGWAMIPLATALFWFVLWYLKKLFLEKEEIALSELIRHGET